MSLVKKNCEICNNEFESYRGVGKYCSDECKGKAKKAHRPKHKEREKQWRAENKDHLKEKQKRWIADNATKLEDYKSKRKEKYHANKEEEKEKRDTRRANNISKYSATQHKYRSQDRIRIKRNKIESDRYEHNKEEIRNKVNKRHKTTNATAINKYIKWTKLEENRLIYLHKKRIDNSEIAKELNRTLNSVYNRVRKLHKDGRLNLHFGSKHIFF
jgi:hypothetical protein